MESFIMSYFEATEEKTLPTTGQRYPYANLLSDIPRVSFSSSGIVWNPKCVVRPVDPGVDVDDDAALDSGKLPGAAFETARTHPS